MHTSGSETRADIIRVGDVDVHDESRKRWLCWSCTRLGWTGRTAFGVYVVASSYVNSNACRGGSRTYFHVRFEVHMCMCRMILEREREMAEKATCK